MSSLDPQRGVAVSEQQQRPSANLPWLLLRLICLAILVVGMAAPCWAEERPVIENTIGMKLVSIPAGEFLMGATEKETAIGRQKGKEDVQKLRDNGDEDKAKNIEQLLEVLQSELPQHRVVITKPFFLGKYEVTQKEFSAIMGFNPSAFSPNSKIEKVKGLVAGLDTSLFPVERVSWEDAVEFCRQLSAIPEEVAAGRTYRLPTEAQWEYAFRAGTTTRFYWGDKGRIEEKGKKSVFDDYAWSNHNSDNRPHPVGQLRPNLWGLFDMAGNIAEWCADWYDPQAYAAAPLRDPPGPFSGTERIIRGQCFGSNQADMRSAGKRRKETPNMRQRWSGFRVACDVSAPAPQVVAATPEPTEMKDAEARLKEKGLTRRMGFFLLPDESQFIRYCSTIERLRVACFHAQKECQDAQRQLSRVQSAKAGAIQSRMQARSAIGYSDTWRDHWASVRARNNANDAMMLVDLSKEGIQKWQQDAQADLDSAVELFGQQIDKLQKMYEKLQADYAKLYEDKTVKHALAEMNSQGRTTYRIGPTPSAAAAMKKLEHEQGLLAQFKKN